MMYQYIREHESFGVTFNAVLIEIFRFEVTMKIVMHFIKILRFLLSSGILINFDIAFTGIGNF